MASSLPAQASCLQDQRYTDGHFLNARGQKLFYCAAFPPESHSLRFTHVYRHLCLNGYGVIAYDMLGHGQSESEKPGLRAHGSEFQYFVDDTNQFELLTPH
ncbi:uncharacterized protein PITG_21282 [Phytophthora infestans T30-4]|uniref:Serine aminopeptidase S33 domain-containing protein n=1 Tax=Phytophthora infestans (strain T30-4) TaxID=403677 RepID=D0P3J4_PHYIT|nr:uncharacterized protein PITG_21282 [Phytophthora infestans T30-4]EEY60038.1 conserved hypothetical protein [Phytophthora infestans T30-4]|eukprot:XP_002895128.1 conserved hypothetical protein [Phytophthora infestans T30-4]